MMPTIARITRQICFALMLSCGIEIFSFGVASRNQEAPLRSINSVPLWLILEGSLGAWTLFSLIFIGITMHYAKIHPIWALLHLVAALLMLAFFATYLRFEPFDVPIWGPLAVDLGIVVSTGIEAIYNSADRGLLRRFWVYAMGHESNDGHDSSNHDGNGIPMDPLGPDGRPRSRSV